MSDQPSSNHLTPDSLNPSDEKNDNTSPTISPPQSSTPQAPTLLSPAIEGGVPGLGQSLIATLESTPAHIQDVDEVDEVKPLTKLYAPVNAQHPLPPLPLPTSPPKQAHFELPPEVPTSLPSYTIVTPPPTSPSWSSPTLNENSQVASPTSTQLTPSASSSGATTGEVPRVYTAPTWHTASRRPSLSSSPPVQAPAPPARSLREVSTDLRTLLRVFLIFLPSSLRRLSFLIPPPLRRIATAILHKLAMALHKRGALASNLVYDSLVFFWKMLVDIFFREIRSRGGWKVPQEGGVIFVVGPHHNQFLDPLLLMSEVRRESGRRISFLVAEKSMKLRFIGQAARLMQSISVVRAQDLAAPGVGTVSISSEDPLIVRGIGTNFTTDFGPKCQIMLAKAYGSSCMEVVEVIDDTTLKVKKEFPKKATELLQVEDAKSTYKVIPHVDQSRMYHSVYQKLKEGGCIGIFPEGGSHDRTDLLPLKAGVSIMALGALSANPDLKLRIVPVGLSYFHPHRFRSRAVVEFGSPIEIPAEFVEGFNKGGDEKRSSISGMMDLVVNGLKSVTVRAPDYETLMLIQATRRLYRPPGQHLTLGQIVELNKRFIAGYEVYKDEPKLKELTLRVKEYNTLLRYMGLKDHQIERVSRPLWRSAILLCYRVGLFAAWGILALPGVVLNAPIFIAATVISRRKAKEALAASTVKIKGNDVLATWKVLVALAGAPALYSVYAVGATVLAFRWNLQRKYKIWAPIVTLIGLPMIGYSALKFGEVGMDVYKSLRPLFLSVIPGNEKQLDKLRTMRASLQEDISGIVNEFGPQLFEDFQQARIIPPSSVPPPPGLTRKRSTYGPQGTNTFLTHPMTWVDEYLFGWSQSQVLKPSGGGQDSDGPDAQSGGYVSGYTTDEQDRGDFDEAIHILSREQDHVDTSPDPSLRTRRVSRSRSRSQLDLTALDAAVARESSASRSGLSVTGVTSAVDDSGEGGARRRKGKESSDE